MNKYIKYYNYDVYENGDIYSYYVNRYLKGEINKFGYKQVTLFINGEKIRIRVHQLVAKLFLDKPNSNEKMIINHKDGNKLNNHYSNLEWCTYDYNNYHARINKLNDVHRSNSNRWKDKKFRDNTSRNISSGRIESGCAAGKLNPNFRYEIYDKNGNEYNRKSLTYLLNLSQSRTDSLIREYVNGKKNIHFQKYGIYIKDTKSKVNRLSKA